jgi:hypothetical protein
MQNLLDSGGLAPWGQTAAVILGIYLFVSILLGLIVVGALMFTFAYLRDKVELLAKLRPLINEFNQAFKAAQKGEPLPQDVPENRIIQVAAQVPKMAANLPERTVIIEQRVEQGSDRVAKTVIEVRARTEMVKTMARAFFLPGLKHSRSQRQAHIELPSEQLEAQIIAEHEPLQYEEITIVRSSR